MINCGVLPHCQGGFQIKFHVTKLKLLPKPGMEKGAVAGNERI